MKNIMKKVFANVVCVLAGAGVAAMFLWVISLAGNFKGF